jgi:peptide/nickel transport system ATP-binding protein
VVIAIALLCSPSLIIADEPSTALDVTIQAEIMELLREFCLHEHMGLILITHDLAVVSQVTQRIAVMYAGRIVEVGDTQQIISRPRHPYTQGLLAALPQEKPRKERLDQIPGVMPTLMNIPPGCAFSDRCPRAQEICRRERPRAEFKKHGNRVACHFVD